MQIAAKPIPTCKRNTETCARRLYEHIFYNYYRLQHW